MEPVAAPGPHLTPQFTHTPGQVAFSPDGTQLIVATKASTNAINVLHIGRWGQPSAAPVVNTEPGTLPFAVTFDTAGHSVVAETGIGSLLTFRLNLDETVTQIDAVASTQTAPAGSRRQVLTCSPATPAAAAHRGWAPSADTGQPQRSAHQPRRHRDRPGNCGRGGYARRSVPVHADRCTRNRRRVRFQRQGRLAHRDRNCHRGRRSRWRRHRRSVTPITSAAPSPMRHRGRDLPGRQQRDHHPQAP